MNISLTNWPLLNNFMRLLTTSSALSAFSMSFSWILKITLSGIFIEPVFGIMNLMNSIVSLVISCASETVFPLLKSWKRSDRSCSFSIRVLNFLNFEESFSFSSTMLLVLPGISEAISLRTSMTSSKWLLSRS